MLTNLGNNEDSAFVYLEQSRKNQGNVIHDSFDSQEEEKKHKDVIYEEERKGDVISEEESPDKEDPSQKDSPHKSAEDSSNSDKNSPKTSPKAAQIG